MFFIQVPAAGAHEEDGVFRVEGVAFAFGALERDGFVKGVGEVALAFHLIFPGGGVGVFKVGHEDIGAAVESVDNHLAITGASDFDATVGDVGGDGGDGPGGTADTGRTGQKVGKFALCGAGLAFDTGGEQLLATGFELVVQGGKEVDGFGCENGVLVRGCVTGDLSGHPPHRTLVKRG